MKMRPDKRLLAQKEEQGPAMCGNCGRRKNWCSVCEHCQKAMQERDGRAVLDRRYS